MTTFTWLHLSDFHFKKGTDWQRDVVLQSLMRDVIKELPGTDLAPDAVFVTGDIAHSGKDEEYEQARIFFDDAAEVLGHTPRKAWFLAPGNHDVDRGLVGLMQKKMRQHFSDLNVTNELLNDPKTFPDFAARQHDYLRFTKDFLGPKRAWDAKAPWQTGSIDIDDLKIAVLCLNSAWAAQDDQDQGNLLIGEFQARDALKQAADADIRIGLFHHPWDWLRPFDAKKVKSILTASEGCHLLLRGHLHDTELALTMHPGFSTAELAAGACWQGAGWPHAVTVGQMDMDARKLHLHVFAYSEREGGFWTKDNTLSRHMKNGVWTVDFPQSWFASGQEDGGVSDPQPTEWVPDTYREELERTCGRHENLIDADKPLVCRLREVYIPLKTAWLEPDKRRERERKVKDDPEAMAQVETASRELTDLLSHDRKHFLIVGGPGTGKSTFMRYATLQTLDSADDLLPLYLQLKDFGSWLQNHSGKQAALLHQWATEQLNDLGLADLSRRLGQGRVVWLLDGLDEIFDQALRLRACHIIGAAMRHKTYGQDRLILTTRPHALAQKGVGDALDLGDHTAQIQALDGADQRQFLFMWFTALYEHSADAAKHRDDLWQKMNRNTNLTELRGTPLLLSMIATLYHLGKSLPERRAELYDKAVWNLLQRRYGPHGRSNGSEGLVREMRQALMKVARHIQSQGDVREISERDLWRILKKQDAQSWQDWTTAEKIAVDLGAHSGLLTMDKNRFNFVHLGFQEFLTARSIAFDDDPLALLKEHLQEGAWREVVLLTIGHLFEIGNDRLGKSLIEGLLQDNAGTPCHRLALAVDGAAQAPDGELGSLKRDLTHQALTIIEDKTNKASEDDRFHLGIALGYLGDPRLGLNKAENWLQVTETCHFARYLTTNQDFKAFIYAGGYQNMDWWDDAGRAWLEEEMPDPANRYPDDWWDKDWNVPNQPVVGVSFYESRAFCRWLTSEGRKPDASWLPDGWEVRLPTGEEWGQAAGEGKQKYPWGDDKPDATRANYDDRLSRTSPVGLYPNGAAGGIQDLAGNVYEWTLEIDEDKSVALRGGSWFGSVQYLAYSGRFGFRAGNRDLIVGFRCCVAPRAL